MKKCSTMQLSRYDFRLTNFVLFLFVFQFDAFRCTAFDFDLYSFFRWVYYFFKWNEIKLGDSRSSSEKSVFYLQVLYYHETVAKPTHLELDNGQTQPRSANGKSKHNQTINQFKQTILRWNDKVIWKKKKKKCACNLFAFYKGLENVRCSFSRPFLLFPDLPLRNRSRSQSDWLKSAERIGSASVTLAPNDSLVLVLRLVSVIAWRSLFPSFQIECMQK